MRSYLPLVLFVLLLAACGDSGGPAQPAGGQPGTQPEGGDDEIKALDITKRPPTPPARPAVPAEDPQAMILKDASRMMGSPDSEQRLLAIEKLLEMKDRKEAGRLVSKLLLDTDEDVRSVAVEAIGQLEYKAGATELRTVIGSDEEPTVRKQALQALYEIVGKEAVKDLIGALGDDDHNVRAAAVTLLGNSGSAEAADPLLALIAGDGYDYNEQVRLAAVTAIGKLDAKKAVPTVIEALEDQRELVRTEAAKVLGTLGDRKAVPGLMRIVDPELSPRESSKTIEHAVKSLTALTGEKIPFSLDDDLEKQDAARKAWVAWWKENKGEYE